MLTKGTDEDTFAGQSMSSCTSSPRKSLSDTFAGSPRLASGGGLRTCGSVATSWQVEIDRGRFRRVPRSAPSAGARPL